MSYIVWNGELCQTFPQKAAKEAWEYVNRESYEPFKGWLKSKTNGAYNRVAVINQFDTLEPWSTAPTYMQPGSQL